MMRSPPEKVCTNCGAETSSRAPEGWCAPCLLGLGLAIEETDPGHDFGSSAVGVGFQGVPVSFDQAPGAQTQRLGDYALLEEIGRGGMGVVYRARQLSLDRIVAVKVILAGQFARREDMLRFRADAEAAARLQHPNIVSIHQTGEHEGRPYFSMDYVGGGDLAELVSGKPLAGRAAAQLVQTVAEAVHYVHDLGILHRDLKPSNILLDDVGHPRIADFGLARRLEKDSFLTLTGQVLGSPNFMPPEQAGVTAKAGRSSDVYGLGGILFYLLTGRPPFLGESVTETLDQVRHSEPVSPRLLNPAVPRDLETICLKCLEKEPGQRYSTARAVAEELARFLRGEPVQARPVGRPEKVWRWCRRKPALAGSLGSAVLLFLAVAIGSPIAAMRIAHARDAESGERRRAEELRQRTEEDLYARQIRLAQQNLDDNQLILARESLRDIGESPYQRIMRGWEWRYLAAQSGSQERSRLVGHNARVIKVAFAPNDTLLASTSADGEVRLWDWCRGSLIQAWQAHDRPLNPKSRQAGHTLTFSPDGGTLITAGSDGSIKLWDVGTRRLKSAVEVEGAAIDLDFSPDGSLFAAAVLGRKAVWWEVARGEPERLGEIEGDHFGRAVAFTSRGRELWFATLRGTKRVDLTDPRQLVELTTPPDLLAVSDDGEWVVTEDEGGGRFRIWNPGTGKVRAVVPGHPHSVVLAIAPDLRWLASGDEDGNVTVFDLDQEKVRRVLRGHEADVATVAFSHAGGVLASGGNDATIRLWDCAFEPRTNLVQAHTGKVQEIRFLKDSDHFISAGEESVTSGTRSSRYSSVKFWQFRPDGGGSSVLVTATNSGPVGHQLVSILAGQKQVAFNSDLGGEFTTRAVRILALPDLTLAGEIQGSHMSQSTDGSVTVRAMTNCVMQWSVTDGAPHLIGNLPFRINNLIVAPDGYVAVATDTSGDGRLHFFDLFGRRPVARIPGHDAGVHMLAFSPDSRRLASASWDRTVGLWDPARRQLISRLKGHRGQINCVAFSPDNQTLASGGADETVRLWHVRTGRELLVLPASVDDIWSVAFSPDGRWLLAGGLSGRIQFWRAPDWTELPQPNLAANSKEGGNLRSN